MHFKKIPVIALHLALTILTLSVFALAVVDSPFARIAIVIACLSAVICAPRAPVASAITIIFITIEISLFNELGSIFIPVSFGIVAGVLVYLGYLQGGIVYAITVVVFGTVDLENRQIVPEALTGSALLAVFLFAPLLVGYIQGVRERKHEEERVHFSAALQRHRQATIQTLHDSVASTLTSSILRAENLTFEPDISPAIKENIKLIAQENRKAITQIRELIKVLNSESLEESDFQVTTYFEKQLGEFNTLLGSHNFKVEITNSGLTPEVMASLPVLTMPVMLELGSNITKYAAPGTTVYVSINSTERGIRVEICNTIGAEQSSNYLSTGLGLKEIQKEMMLHNGEFTWGAKNDKWLTYWTIPRKGNGFGS